MDPNIPSDWKCADIFVYQNTTVLADGPGLGSVGAKQVTALCIDSTYFSTPKTHITYSIYIAVDPVIL